MREGLGKPVRADERSPEHIGCQVGEQTQFLRLSLLSGHRIERLLTFSFLVV